MKKKTEPKKPAGEIPRLSASQAAQWLNCEMSRTVKTGRNIFEDSSAAQVGTAIHEYAELWVNKLTEQPKNEISNQSKIYYSRNKNFVDDFVSFYIEQIKINLIFAERNAGPGETITLAAESKFEYKSEYAEFVAKLDALMIGSDWATIYDLKTGFVEVSPDCDQMVVTAMILKKLRPKLKTITACIIQPGLSRIATEDLSDVDPDILDELKFDRLKYFNVGSQCTYCAGNSFCPKFKENYENFSSPEFAGKTYNRAEEWGEILESVNITLKILESVKETALNAAKIGVVPVGYELGFKKIRRAFRSGLTAEDIATELGISKTKILKTSIETPAQVEKLLKTEQQKEKFAGLVSQPSAVYLKKIGEGL